MLFALKEEDHPGDPACSLAVIMGALELFSLASAVMDSVRPGRSINFV